MKAGSQSRSIHERRARSEKRSWKLPRLEKASSKSDPAGALRYRHPLVDRDWLGRALRKIPRLYSYRDFSSSQGRPQGREHVRTHDQSPSNTQWEEQAAGQPGPVCNGQCLLMSISFFRAQPWGEEHMCFCVCFFMENWCSQRKRDNITKPDDGSSCTRTEVTEMGSKRCRAEKQEGMHTWAGVSSCFSDSPAHSGSSSKSVSRLLFIPKWHCIYTKNRVRTYTISETSQKSSILKASPLFLNYKPFSLY